MKVSVKELSGFLLDYAVSEARRLEAGITYDVVEDEKHGYRIEELSLDGDKITRIGFNPSRVRSSGLFLINNMMRSLHINIFNKPNRVFMACTKEKLREKQKAWFVFSGHTLTEAASRCYVYHQLGELVDIPEHYVNAQIDRDIKRELAIERSKNVKSSKTQSI